MTLIEVAYWAGLVDGEGHIGIRRIEAAEGRPAQYIARFVLVMSEHLLVREFAGQFGLSFDFRDNHNDWSKRPLYRAEGAGQIAAVVARTLYPGLRVKRRQAELLVLLEEEKRLPGLRNTPSSISTFIRNGREFSRQCYRTESAGQITPARRASGRSSGVEGWCSRRSRPVMTSRVRPS